VRFHTFDHAVVDQHVSALHAYDLLGRGPNDHLA
jgi:hypothetical protein